MACLCDGAKVLEAEGSTVAEVMVDLRRRYPAVGGRLCDEAGTPSAFVQVYLEDEIEIKQLQGPQTPVESVLRLHVLAGAAGG
jgi:molybdopterin synthase sulfur carrier subunit